MLFWKYYSNKESKTNKAEWGTGLFRYLEDGETARIVADTAAVCGDETTKSVLDDLLDIIWSGKGPVPTASGPLAGKNL